MKPSPDTRYGLHIGNIFAFKKYLTFSQSFKTRQKAQRRRFPTS